MSKVLGITCSYRRLGNCDVLLQEALLGAKEAGAEVEYLRLSDLHIKSCRGCLNCVFKGGCVIKNDDMALLWDKLKEYDGLLIAAPTYLFSPAGIVKMAIDRAMIGSRELDALSGRHRAAATISVAGNNKWNPLGLEILNTFPLAYGYNIVNYLEAYAPGPGETLLDDKVVADAHHLGASVVKALEGSPEKKKPAPGQCPVCYSRAFKLATPGEVRCCTCGISGKIIATENNWEIDINRSDMSNHFWTLNHRHEHLEQWVIPSKEVYLGKREAIKEKLKKYRKTN